MRVTGALYPKLLAVNRWVAGSNRPGEPNFPRLCGLPHSLKNAPGYSGDTGIRAGGPGLEFALGARADQRRFLVVLEAQQRTLLLNPDRNFIANGGGRTL